MFAPMVGDRHSKPCELLKNLMSYKKIEYKIKEVFK